MNDYPAAHSMDTDWFAVDANGMVALFDTGENGSVPVEWKGEQMESHERVQEWALAGLLGYYVSDILAGGDPSDEAQPLFENKSDLYKGSVDEILLQMESEDALTEFKKKNIQFSRLKTSEGVFVYCPSLEYPRDKVILEEGLVKKGWEDYRIQAWRAGFIEYDADEYGLYEKSREPKTPVMIGQLPEKVKGYLSAISMKDAEFQHSEKLQPIEMIPCETWGSIYLASDGKTIRVVPGHEKKVKREDLKFVEAEGFELDFPDKAINSSASETGQIKGHSQTTLLHFSVGERLIVVLFCAAQTFGPALYARKNTTYTGLRSFDWLLAICFGCAALGSIYLTYRYCSERKVKSPTKRLLLLLILDVLLILLPVGVFILPHV